MDVKREQICRLCLKMTKNECKDVDETVELMFNILLLKLDFDITGDTIICQSCVEFAKKCLNFKYVCVNTETVILSLSIATKESKHDIKVICQKGENGGAFFDEDFNICRFCLTRSGRNAFVSLGILMNGTVFDMLSRYLPEMDLNVTEDPMVCTSCRETLEGYFYFVTYVDIEVKIKSYCKEKRSDHTCQIKLANVESKIRLFACSLCAFQTNYKCVLSGHMLVHKDIFEVEMFTCSLCTFKTRHKKSLANHMLIHKDISEIKMFTCSLCAYKSKTNCNLKKHMLIHKDVSEIKMFTCSLCAYKSKTNCNLRKHMFIHKDISEIKMFTCSLCAFESKYKNSLTKHMSIHKDGSEIQMYKCSLCANEYKCKGTLKKHLLIHKDISEFKMKNFTQ